MNPRAQIRMLPDSRRVHMHDGPIDLIIEAFGAAQEVERAYKAAAARFVSVLDELCTELSFLRTEARPHAPRPKGPIARRMLEAVLPYTHGARTNRQGHGFSRAINRQTEQALAAEGRPSPPHLGSGEFITPMAAVAGAVAEEILNTMTEAAQLTRAYVNNGGDIALHLTPGENFAIGMVDYKEKGSPRFRDFRNLGSTAFGTARIEFHDPVRGIATSGWRGRSFSLGIADAVTVLAATASMADAAATIIANAVDLPGHPAIHRVPARDLAPDTDLGDRLVTQAVGELSPDEINQALSAGLRCAESLQHSGLIHAAALNLQATTLVSNQQALLVTQGVAS